MAEEEEELAPARKIFVHNVAQYLGSNLSKRIAASEDEKFEIIGTLGSPSDVKPRWVSRVVEPTAEAMKAAFLECEVTVLDCLNQMQASEELLAAIAPLAELDESKVIIGISSVMTWTRTSPDAEEPEKALTEEEYKRRRPHSRFKQLLALEKLVTRAKRPGLRTHVVAAGVTYGNEEDVLHRLFKAAWKNQPLPLMTLAEGANVLPTIHVNDVCSIVLKLFENDSAPPYLLGVDAGQQSEEAQTVATITSKLSGELGTGEVTRPDEIEVRCTTDYEFFQVGIKLAPSAVDDLGIEWHAKEGLLAHLPAVVREYRESRGLMPMCVLVHGNDVVAKRALAAAVGKEYKLPVIDAAAVLAAKGEGETDAKALIGALTTTACRNQGYVLEGYPRSCDEAKGIFGAGGEGEEGAEAPAEGEGEEAASAGPSSAAAPEFVLVCEGDDEAVKAKVMALDPPPMGEEELGAFLAAYASNNAEDAPTAVLAALDGVDSLGLDAELEPEAALTKAATFLGPRRNYGPTAEELQAKADLEQEAAEEKAAAEAAAAAAREAEEKAEKERREEYEKRRVAELQQQARGPGRLRTTGALPPPASLSISHPPPHRSASFSRCARSRCATT